MVKDKYMTRYFKKVLDNPRFYLILYLSVCLNWILTIVFLRGPFMISTSARCWRDRDTKFYGWLLTKVDNHPYTLKYDGPNHCERAYKDWRRGKMCEPNAEYFEKG